MRVELTLDELTFVITLNGFKLKYADKVAKYEYRHTDNLCRHLHSIADVLSTISKEIELPNVSNFDCKYKSVLVIRHNRYTLELVIDRLTSRLIKAKLSNSISGCGVEADLVRLLLTYSVAGDNLYNRKANVSDILDELSTNYRLVI